MPSTLAHVLIRQPLAQIIDIVEDVEDMNCSSEDLSKSCRKRALEFVLERFESGFNGKKGGLVRYVLTPYN